MFVVPTSVSPRLGISLICQQVSDRSVAGSRSCLLRIVAEASLLFPTAYVLLVIASSARSFSQGALISPFHLVYSLSDPY